MDYAALFAAGVAGLAIGGAVSEILHRKLIRVQKALIGEQRAAMSEAYKDCWRMDCALNSLRANCFLTNERGHRVRYANASVAVRERAEGGQA